jgi:hypothetical protein
MARSRFCQIGTTMATGCEQRDQADQYQIYDLAAGETARWLFGKRRKSNRGLPVSLTTPRLNTLTPASR